MLDRDKLEINTETAIMHQGTHIVANRMLRKERKAWIESLPEGTCQDYFDRGLLVPDPEEVREGESLEAAAGAVEEVAPAEEAPPSFPGWASDAARDAATGLVEDDFRGRPGSAKDGTYTKGDVIDLLQERGV